MLLGDNTGGGAIMLRPISFQCDGVWVLTGPPFTHTYILTYACLIPTCSKFDMRLTLRYVTVAYVGGVCVYVCRILYIHTFMNVTTFGA